MARHRCSDTPGVVHESVTMLQDRNCALDRLLRQGSPRDLTLADVEAIVPPRNPQGCPQNYLRGQMVGRLNRAGFTLHRKPIA